MPKEQELETLKGQAENLKDILEEIRKRIEEIEQSLESNLYEVRFERQGLYVSLF